MAGLGTVQAEHSVDTDFLTTGHTTFLNAGTTFDECFAGIAGAVMTRVVWFNGATLFNRMANGGDTWIYATETLDGPGHDENNDGADDHTGVKPFDPRKETLFATGNIWTFPDENDPNEEWQVYEYYFLSNVRTPRTEEGNGETAVVVPTEQKKVYVYAVQTSEHAITDTTLHRDYNFVMVINTCQFLHNGNGTAHTDGDDSNPRQPSGQHDPNDVPPGETPGTHPHNEFSVDIFIGGKPKAVPLPADPDQAEQQAGTDGEGGGSS